MEATIEKLKESRIKTTTVIEESDRAAAEERALKRLAEQVNIKGFRAGMAPAHMVRERVTAEALLQETVRVLLPDVMKVALEKSKAKPILRPTVNVVSTKPLTLALTFVEHPPVSLKKPESLKVEKKIIGETTDKETEEFIRKVLTQDRIETPVERAAKKDDLVRMALSASKKGKPVDELTVGNYSLTIGSEDLLAELEPALMSMKKGDKKSVDISFPKTHGIPALRGEKISVEISVQSVAEVRLPELTAEYLQTRLGTPRTPDAFRSDVRDMLKQRKTSEEMKRREEELYEKVRAATSVEIAPELVDAEVQEMVADLHQKLEKQKMTMDDWLKTTGKEPKAVIDEMKDIARSRIHLRYGMQELATKLQMEPTESEMTERMNVESGMAKKQGQKIPEKEMQPGGSVYEQIRFDMKMQKLIGHMIADAK